MKNNATFTVLCPDYESASKLKELSEDKGIPGDYLTIEHVNILSPEVYLILHAIQYRDKIKDIMKEYPELYVHDGADELRELLKKFANK